MPVKPVFLSVFVLCSFSVSVFADDRCFNVVTQNWEWCSDVESHNVGAVKIKKKKIKTLDDHCYDVATGNWEWCEGSAPTARSNKSSKKPAGDDRCYNITTGNFEDC